MPAWVPAMRGVDLALIDPPYEFDGWDQLLGSARKCRTSSPRPVDEIAAAERLGGVKARRYGRTWVTQLERVA